MSRCKLSIEDDVVANPDFSLVVDRLKALYEVHRDVQGLVVERVSIEVQPLFEMELVPAGAVVNLYRIIIEGTVECATSSGA